MANAGLPGGVARSFPEGLRTGVQSERLLLGCCGVECSGTSPRRIGNQLEEPGENERYVLQAAYDDHSITCLVYFLFSSLTHCIFN